MKNKKMVMALAITLMAIGFASVSTVLYLNGQTFVASNTDDFDVYFSKAIENGVDKTNEVIKDKTHIEFTTELTGVNDKYILDYDVTNGSKQYDANLVMNCVGGNEYLRVENKFDITKALPARTTRSGVLTLTVIKVPLTEMSVSIVCEISGNAVERDIVGGEIIEDEIVDYLLPTENGLAQSFIIEEYGSEEEFGRLENEICSGEDSATCDAFYQNFEEKYAQWKEQNEYKAIWDGINIKNIESITFKDTSEVPAGKEGKDLSNNQNGSIMMYNLDEDNDGMLELYIGQNGGVNANPNSSYLFAGFTNTISINGLEYLKTSKVTSMNVMFSFCNSLTSLDISGFDTSNVTDMSGMFLFCNSLTSLDVSGFNTSKVTDMSAMFADCRNLTSLDVSGFDTSKVTDMSAMFSFCNSLTSLDVSRFDTSNVTNMSAMFQRCNILTVLDVSKFDTSKVTDIGFMFSDCGSLTILDVSHFDTSNVTDMQSMFQSCKNLAILDVSGFDTSKVAEMMNMFYDCSNLITTITIKGTECTSYTTMFKGAAISNGAKIIVNYTEDASDLVDQMIATKSSNSNVVKGTQVA